MKLIIDFLETMRLALLKSSHHLFQSASGVQTLLVNCKDQLLFLINFNVLIRALGCCFVSNIQYPGQIFQRLKSQSVRLNIHYGSFGKETKYDGLHLPGIDTVGIIKEIVRALTIKYHILEVGNLDQRRVNAFCHRFSVASRFEDIGFLAIDTLATTN